MMNYLVKTHEADKFNSKFEFVIPGNDIPDEVKMSGKYCVYQFIEAFCIPRGYVMECFAEVEPSQLKLPS